MRQEPHCQPWAPVNTCFPKLKGYNLNRLHHILFSSSTPYLAVGTALVHLKEIKKLTGQSAYKDSVPIAAVRRNEMKQHRARVGSLR